MSFGVQGVGVDAIGVAVGVAVELSVSECYLPFQLYGGTSAEAEAKVDSYASVG